MKQFVALARVSSRQQEREGFSLDAQEDAMKRYAKQVGGEIIRLFRIAETASKGEERSTFKAMVAFVKRRSHEIDGMLFYKVDRAARNLVDYVELERLESDYGVPFISVSQQTESSPAGRMMRRTLANMASFFTEQMSVDIKQGLSRRVQEGWFHGPPPFGYKTDRIDGRSIVILNPDAAPSVRRMFHLYAYEGLTVEMVVKRLAEEGYTYRASEPKFNRSSVHTVLHDRSYVGEIQFRGQWHPGKHEPLVDLATFTRVQSLLGGHIFHGHQHTYAGGKIHCGHCGHSITGERKTKKNGKVYTYYRCTRYNAPGHPRNRVSEVVLDNQVLAIFDRMRIDNDDIRDWFRAVLAAQTNDAQSESRAKRSELLRQQSLLATQQDKLLNLLLETEIDQEAYNRKVADLRKRQDSINLQLEVVSRSHDEMADLAAKAFELSQMLREKWLTADYTVKRRILDIVQLNSVLDGASLVMTIRKPFDVLAEGLVLESSGAEGS